MLRKALSSCLEQVETILDLIEQGASDRAEVTYRERSLGKHVRHIIDHILAFKASEKSGLLDYDRRNRGSDIEVDWGTAREFLDGVREWLVNAETPSVPLRVKSEIDCQASVSELFESNSDRELLYLINHTIHHIAFMRLLMEQEGYHLPDHIGLAPSTASYLRDLEQQT